MTEKLNAWLTELLAAEPEWDALGPNDGSGLFPQGCRELWRRRDILGNTRRRLRLTLALRLQTRREGREMARLLEALTRRAEETAPLLGEEQSLRIQDGRQTARDSRGQARYELKLIFEFTQ